MPSHLNSIVLGVVIRNHERKSNTENIVNNILKCSFGWSKIHIFFQNTNRIADI